MEPAYWTARWGEGKIGFHEGAPNAFLVRHATRLAGCRRVLVPLCGKTEDLAHLAELGHEVIGIELVEDAARAFFAEHGAVPTVTQRGPLAIYTAGAITIIVGDLFDVTAADSEWSIDGIYDRAALVALPEEVRQRYADHLIALCRPWMCSLTISLEYDQALMAGPPFSVTDVELLRLYDGYTIEELASAPDTTRAVPMLERCSLITG